MSHSNFHYPTCPDTSFFKIEQKVECGMIEEALSKTDAIHLAAEVGRLDIVSLLLAGLALLLGVTAIFGFLLVKREAIEAAKQAANDCSPKCTDEWLAENFEKKLADFISEETGRDLLLSAIEDAKQRQNLKNKENPTREDFTSVSDEFE